ncbi:MAG TPA: MraY family glycosyltransferase [Acidobacteriota bacterium]|nr:MraY family glycosyltransferase [Acidobacteriota bacterium]
MWWQIGLPVFGIGLVAGAVLVPVAMRIAVAYDLMDRPGHHKRHKKPVPILGGAAMFVSFWLAIGIAALLFPDVLGEQLPVLPYVLAGALIIFLVGLSDDLSPLSPWIKLAAQVAAGLMLYMGGMKIDPLTIPFVGSVGIGPLSILVTVLWVVGLSNAINLIDGLDGLAAGVSLIGAGTLVAVGTIYGVQPVVIFACTLIGFLAVFLWYNRYPARIFLGDSGSLQLGYYFAVISLLVPIRTLTAAALYLPLLTLGVPILETVVSLSRRLVAGRSLMKADRRHLFHYLSLAGLSPRTVVILFYGLSLAFGVFTVAMIYLNRRWVFGFLVLFMVVISVAFYIFMTTLSRSRKRPSGP